MYISNYKYFLLLLQNFYKKLNNIYLFITVIIYLFIIIIIIISF